MTKDHSSVVRALLLFLLLELIAAAQVSRADGSSLLVGWARSAVSPLGWGASWASRSAGDLYHGLGDLRTLLDDVQRLREESEQLRAENLLLREDLEALRAAREQLPLMTPLDDRRRLARCSFRNSARGLMLLQLAGDQPVRANVVVVGGDGLVGRVTSASRHHAWVQLITHPAAAVAVRDAEGRLRGLVTGSGPGELTVEYIPRSADLVRGAVLLTSGSDGIYPPGIPVARVSSIRETDAAFLEVAAVPTSQLDALRTVFLLPEWSAAQGLGDVTP